MNPYHEHSDKDLVDLLITGDDAAFETIYHRYAGTLYKFARRNVSMKEDCQEIVQDIFETLWSRRRDLGHITSLDAYLFRAVKYKVIRYFQHSTVKKKYMEHYRLFEAVYESSEQGERDPLALQGMIERGLANLPERCRFAVMLRLTENLSNADIACRMNIKKTTVENYMGAAYKYLRSNCPNLFRSV